MVHFYDLFETTAHFLSLYRKISITGPCSDRGPFPSLDPKTADFTSKFQKKNRSSDKGPPTNIEKKLVLPYAETSQSY